MFAGTDSESARRVSLDKLSYATETLYGGQRGPRCRQVLFRFGSGVSNRMSGRFQSGAQE